LVSKRACPQLDTIKTIRRRTFRMRIQVPELWAC
jgi:hypothetical protein